jgi:hypothetical protein
MTISFFAIVIAWITVAALLFEFFMRNVEISHPAMAITAFVCAFFVAPGIIVGHGAAPFPGGLAFVLLWGESGLRVNPLWGFNLFNFLSWIGTFGILWRIGIIQRRRKRRLDSTGSRFQS